MIFILLTSLAGNNLLFGQQKSSNDSVDIFSSNMGYDKTKARGDIEKDKAMLIIPGNNGVFHNPKDSLFEKKYHLKYTSLGCGNPDVAEYNLLIAEYLDKTYGKEWRAVARKDVIGFKK